MTTLQQAQELLAKLPEKDLPKIITFMTDLLEHKASKTNWTMPEADPQELHREFEALLKETKKIPAEDIPTLLATAMSEKYGNVI